jgi:hypothetical protein
LYMLPFLLRMVFGFAVALPLVSSECTEAGSPLSAELPAAAAAAGPQAVFESVKTMKYIIW